MTNENAINVLRHLIPPRTSKAAFDAFRQAIEMAIEALSQPELQWIPVEQDLPKIGEYVLCETTTCYFGKYHVCKFVDKDKWVDKPHFDWDRNGFPCVVAWARFEPYREVE